MSLPNNEGFFKYINNLNTAKINILHRDAIKLSNKGKYDEAIEKYQQTIDICSKSQHNVPKTIQTKMAIAYHN